MAATSREWQPGPVLLLGAPGVGKGTQAQTLMDFWGIPQISTGDLIRENIRQETTIGKQFKELVATGIFVPDEVVNTMVSHRLQNPDCARGFVLDGFPRTVGQAGWLDSELAHRAIAGSMNGGVESCTVGVTAAQTPAVPALPLVAVSINVRYDELLRRITGRRTGTVSKRIYNIYTNPPASPGVCDVDGEPLIQRPDDSEEVFEQRMRAFSEQTGPVIEHYRQLGRFEEVDGEQTVAEVTGSILAALERLRGN